MEFWTNSPGTGGAISSEEDFVVEEIPSKKFFVKFRRSGSAVKQVDGPYTLALLRKKSVTTKDALNFIQKELGCAQIGYAGLKDKFAVTSQYLTIKGPVKELQTERIELAIVGPADKFMQVGELEGNKFSITLRSCKRPENAAGVVAELQSRGMPNYFGPQRFGIQGNNYKIGRFLLQRKFKQGLNLINNQSGKNHKSLHQIDKKRLKFYIHSYQSLLFNSLLDKYISLNSKPVFSDFPIVGFNTRLRNDFVGKQLSKMMKKDKITPESFSIRELNIKAIGSSRPAFVKLGKISVEAEKKTVKLCFHLPKGSYATVLIREVTKSKR